MQQRVRTCVAGLVSQLPLAARQGVVLALLLLGAAGAVAGVAATLLLLLLLLLLPVLFQGCAGPRCSCQLLRAAQQMRM
jgi:sugar phosphate permease